MNRVTDFLSDNGFDNISADQEKGGLFYKKEGSSPVWIIIYESYLSVYISKSTDNDSGNIGFNFIEDNYNSFVEAYNQSIIWIKNHIGNS